MDTTPAPESALPHPDASTLPGPWRLARWIEHPYGNVRLAVAGVLAATGALPTTVWLFGPERLRTLALVGLVLWCPFAGPGAVWYAASAWFESRFRMPRLRRRPDRWNRPWTFEHRFGDGSDFRTSPDGLASIFVALLAGAFAATVIPGATGRHLFVGIALAAFAVLALLRGITLTSSRGVHVTWGGEVVAAGAPVLLRFGTLAGGGGMTHAVLVLRAFDEHGDGLSLRRLFARTHVVWAERRELEQDELPTPGGDVELTFSPPVWAPPTCLSQSFPTYWELELRLRIGGVMSGGELLRRVLIPVYALGADENPDSSD